MTTQIEPPDRFSWTGPAFLILFSCLLFFVSLGARDLWNPNEPIYGRAVAEMAARGDWMIPTVNDQVFAEKPILYFWAALSSSKLLGNVDELSLRVPSAIAGVLCVLLTYLLILPYVGRRRALMSAAVFATCYQVFWASRSVQMDILVLLATLGVLVPMTRLLDHDGAARRCLVLAGIAAGLGFAAKGPVAWVVPGIALAGYLIWTRRVVEFLRRPIWLFIVVTLVVASPWYLMLAYQGESQFLYEVLFRQNFTRFVNAWDHQKPWWYYAQYVFIDYAPWSWLLPAAAFVSPKNEAERRLHGLSWIWGLGVILFFSLSDSKRAPYILPIAPAIAALVGGVVERWVSGFNLERRSRIAARFAFLSLGVLFVGAGAWLIVSKAAPQSLQRPLWVIGLVLAVAGSALGYGIFKDRTRPLVAPASLWIAMVALFSISATWALPAANSMKSARDFSGELARLVESEQGTLVSFGFWDWRSGYTYYMDRTIPDFEEPGRVSSFWRREETPMILVEGKREPQLKALLPGARVVLQGKIGSREAFVFSTQTVAARHQKAEAFVPEVHPVGMVR